MPLAYAWGASLTRPITDVVTAAVSTAWLPEGQTKELPLGQTDLESGLITRHRGQSSDVTAVRFRLELVAKNDESLACTVTAMDVEAGSHLWIHASTDQTTGWSSPPETIRRLEDVLREHVDLTEESNEAEFDRRPHVLIARTTGDMESGFERRLRERLLTMAAVEGLPLGQLAIYQREYAGLAGIASGSVLVLRAGHAPLHLPPTVVTRQPVAAAARVHRSCLDEVTAQPPSSLLRRALAIPGMPNSPGGAYEETLLDEAHSLEKDRDTARQESAALRIAYDDLTLDLIEALQEADDRARRIRYLERRLELLGDYGSVTVTVEEPDEPPTSCAEVLERAGEELPHIRVPVDLSPTRFLDSNGAAMVWAGKAWAALRALNEYAEQRASGRHSLNFYRYCADPPPGSLTISASWVAISESDSTRHDPACRSARLFPVPTDVDPSGTAFMESHIKVQRRGGLAPRIHYLDDSQRSGTIYIGYFGRHLPLPD